MIHLWVKIQNINCKTNIDVGQDSSFTLNFVCPPKKVDLLTEMTEHELIDMTVTGTETEGFYCRKQQKTSYNVLALWRIPSL